MRPSQRAGLPVRAGEVRPEPGNVRLSEGHLPVVDADGAAWCAENGTLLDARAAEVERVEDPAEIDVERISSLACEHPDSVTEVVDALSRECWVVGHRRRSDVRGHRDQPGRQLLGEDSASVSGCHRVALAQAEALRAGSVECRDRRQRRGAGRGAEAAAEVRDR
jgi:hypothetical protein